MRSWAKNRLSQKADRIWSKKQLRGLSEDERQFAQQQFRAIYAQQMSKLTAEMAHKKKIRENLQQINETEERNQKETLDKLKLKMTQIEEKRNEKLEGRLKVYKQNDERWAAKLKQIQRKFKEKNREAIEKAQKYRDESQKYWENKQKRYAQGQKGSLNASKANRSQSSTLYVLQQSRNSLDKHKFYAVSSKKTRTFHVDKRPKSLEKQQLSLSASKADLQLQIKLHRQKSMTMQKQKQKQYFQKAMEKLQKIQRRRQKVWKQKQPKISEPSKPRPIEPSHKPTKKDTKQRRLANQTVSLSRAGRNKSLQKLIREHLDQKRRLQQLEFEQRSYILQGAMQKARRDKILKMVKDKVKSLKNSSLGKETGPAIE